MLTIGVAQTDPECSQARCESKTHQSGDPNSGTKMTSKATTHTDARDEDSEELAEWVESFDSLVAPGDESARHRS
jgi:hypothetical protein